MGSPPDDMPPEPAPVGPAEAPGPGRFRIHLDRDRAVGFSILFIAFCAALIVSWKAGEAVRPNVAEAPAPPTTEGLAGFPERVDPLAALSLAHALTEREQLRRIVLQGVASDGTVDVRDPQATIRYELDSAAGEGPEPPRPAGTVRPMHYCGRQSVQVKSDGIAAEPDQPRAMCRASWGEPLPDPRCGPKQLWQVALKRGAAADGRANIDYYRAQEGPAWRFTLPGGQLHFTMYGDCEHELQAAGARPLVP
ncbi:MAG: hypothetical protein RL685_7206 [Pseudomonadota bacterium]